jgi:hypothetical protein
MDVNLANQLLIPKSIISLKEYIYGKVKVEIKDLHLSVDDYKFVS